MADDDVTASEHLVRRGMGDDSVERQAELLRAEIRAFAATMTMWFDRIDCRLADFTTYLEASNQRFLEEHARYLPEFRRRLKQMKKGRRHREHRPSKF